MGWEVLPHPSYSPDLAPSDYHLFGFVKDQLHGQRFETFSNSQNAGRNVHKEVAIMWKNKERSVD
ncbi:hypothetical protein B7P43_G13443 [Cryptotermes secundus]|uniref:Histone-lysine N-methyltransferase SETMAR n=1 Tax=Cryptotermes secundus TaxID=105785 RepID=A0A2J7PNT0_9NEOP|nr:hypothetical protein B7P43_G13443 [Cryptotermes secundus]